jgi:hypothetical protein
MEHLIQIKGSTIVSFQSPMETPPDEIIYVVAPGIAYRFKNPEAVELTQPDIIQQQEETKPVDNPTLAQMESGTTEIAQPTPDADPAAIATETPAEPAAPANEGGDAPAPAEPLQFGSAAPETQTGADTSE